MRRDVIIVGAGLAGLTCAADLTAAGLDVCLLEASDGVGGRVRTDLVDGYRLDRGFQIVLTAYPQVQRRIDLEALALGRFEPGAIVRLEGGLHRVADPRRRPALLPRTLASPVAGVGDKLRAAALVLDVLRGPARDLLRRPDMTTAERLAAAGISDRFVTAFWRPLFAGIGLDPELSVSARRFDIILRMLAVGETGLPREGIGALPAQIAARLPPGGVRLRAAVESLAPGGVVLEDGERVAGRCVVVATDGPSAHRLLGAAVPDPGSRAAACCWFALPAPPLRGSHLVLDGTGAGPALNVVVMSEVQPSYAPAGRALVAAAVPGPDALDPDIGARVVRQLARWLGADERDVVPLRTDVIPHGQPRQAPPFAHRLSVDLGEGVFVCGDHRDTASQQGAMYSGERTARAVRARLAGGRGTHLSSAPAG